LVFAVSRFTQALEEGGSVTVRCKSVRGSSGSQLLGLRLVGHGHLAPMKRAIAKFAMNSLC
jgi:hypothetical protein